MSSRTVFIVATVMFLALVYPTAQAQQAPARPAVPAVQAGDYVIKGYKFRNGATLPEVKLHYRTMGTPIRDAAGKIRNGVLVMHGSSGDASQVLAASFAGPLFGPGGPIDARSHYLIFPDILGNGGSTKPSDGLRAKFPKYGYEDMVDLEYKLVTEHLDINRLRLVMGISMGGMQSYLWGIRHPNAMDGIVTISSLPNKVEGRNAIWRRILVNGIRNAPDFMGGNYKEQPKVLFSVMAMFDMLVQSPVRLNEQYDTYPKVEAYLDDVTEESVEEDDANNIAYRFDASFDYNPAPELIKITAPLLTITFADDELNPIELGVVEREIKKIKNGRYVIMPATPTSAGHRGQVQAERWKDHVAKFMSVLAPIPGHGAAAGSAR